MTVVHCPGGSVRGSIVEDEVRRYTGIPFAVPPIGPRRFRPPQPAEPWPGVRDATGPGGSPLQGIPGFFTGGDEDCLTLNIWAPQGADGLPVLVWLFGGGFEFGSASPPGTDGRRLAAHGVVVVAPNYRVGAFGFAHLAGVGGPDWQECTNLGLQDQAAALRWVRDNIGAFGGDPRNVTVAGGSAGGFSIGSLLAMPCAGGLFDKAIMQSGCTSRVYPIETAEAITHDLFARLGVRTVEEFVDVPGETILAMQREVVSSEIGARNTPGGRSWGCVIDGVVLPENPLRKVERGEVRHIPMIVGANLDEVDGFTMISPETFTPKSEEELLTEMHRCVGSRAEALLTAYRGEEPDADLRRLRVKFLSDWIYRVPTTMCASAQRRAGGDAWSYLFTWHLPDQLAAHGLESPFVFDLLDGPAASDPTALAVRDAMVEAWVAFARCGDPGWPLHEPEGGLTTRELGHRIGEIVEPPLTTRSIWFAD